ncbi:hypothetical protein BGX26_001269 [Mortierella sp. AD094]|nr:hypothetical protein BGX26_001269 [Mortierella sp. AD094]
MTGLDVVDAQQAEERGLTPIESDKDTTARSQSKDAVNSTDVPRGYTDQSRLLPPKELALVFVGNLTSKTFSKFLFMASLDQTIVSVLIPTLGRVFNAPQYIAWVPARLTLKSLLNGYRKNTILLAIFFFLLGSFICGIAPTIIALVIGRGIAGLGAGGMISLTMIIISDVVSLRDRGKYQGIIGSMFGISAVVGPLLGGVLAENSSWRWAFYLNLPIGVVSTTAMVFILKLPAVKGTHCEKLKRVDFLGSLTIVIGIICVLLSTNWGGNEYAWGSAQVVVPYCIGALFLSAFLYVEAFVAVEPILPFRLFKNQSVCATFATSFFIGGAFMGAIFYCPLYFQLAMHDSATKAGLQLLPLVAGMLVAGVGSGILISKTGHYRPFIWAALMIYTAGVALLSLWDEKSGLNVQIGFLFVVGLGLGGCMQSVVLAGQVAVVNADIATVTSMLSFFRSMGGVVNVAIGGSIINNVLTQNGVDPNIYREVFSHPEKYALATQAVFRQCIAWPALALIASLFIQHHVSRKTLGAQEAQGDKVEKSTEGSPGHDATPASSHDMIFSKTIATLATLASALAIAHASTLEIGTLAISNPTKGTTWKVGETVFLQWTNKCSTTADKNAVDVNLMTGGANALRFITRLATIDCSSTNNIRKEFTIPPEAVAATGSYSLMVQTTPPSYSNIFTIETAIDISSSTDVIAGKAVTSTTQEGTNTTAHQNGATSPLKNVRLTAAASTVALAAVFVAAQLL